MRFLAAATIFLFVASAHAAAPVFHAGDVVLISDSFSFCFITTPPPATYDVSVISPDLSTVDYSYPLPMYTPYGVGTYSTHSGVIVTAVDGNGSSLWKAGIDGELRRLGAHPLVQGGYIVSMAPTKTSTLALATVNGVALRPSSELWTVSDSGEVVARDLLPFSDVGGFDVTSDQCTIDYTVLNRIARYDSCTRQNLPDLAVAPHRLSGLRIDAAGNVLVIDAVNGQVLRFASDGTPDPAFPALPLDTADQQAVTAIAFDETGTEILAATSFPCSNAPGLIYLLDRSTGRILSTSEGSRGNDRNGILTVGEWHAATGGVSRRRRLVQP